MLAGIYSALILGHSAQFSDWVRIGTNDRIYVSNYGSNSAQFSDWVRIGTVFSLSSTIKIVA